MTQVKICGVRTFQDALDAARAGADFLGLNFYPPSPRYLRPMEAERLTAALRRSLGDKTPILVGVFADDSPGDMLQIAEAVGLDLIQLSGNEHIETAEALAGVAFKAIHPKTKEDAVAQAKAFLPFAPNDDALPSLLLDAHHERLYGGTGLQASTEVALAVREVVPRLMLAGGLTPDNVAERVQAVQPWGVDVASGVEPAGQKGVKDAEMMGAFIKQATQSINHQ